MIKQTKLEDIKHDWHLIDAHDQILGRLSTVIAGLLMGKTKPYFVHHLDCGDYVVVINAKDIKVTGRKATQKEYQRFSGYPGGLKTITFKDVLAKNPDRIIYEAVRGMLPRNKLADRMITRLYIYADDQHPYKTRFPAS